MSLSGASRLREPVLNTSGTLLKQRVALMWRAPVRYLSFTIEAILEILGNCHFHRKNGMTSSGPKFMV